MMRSAGAEVSARPDASTEIGRVVQADASTGDRFAVVARLALALLGAVVLWRLARVVLFVPVALRYPYELDYGEGIVLQQMRNMLRGLGYSPLGVFPAIVYHYPPVYHLTVAAVAAVTGLDDLVAGRVVSLCSTAGSALVAGRLVWRLLDGAASRGVRRMCGVVTATVLVSAYAVQLWAPLMRVDMLALLLDLGGVALVIAAIARPRLIHAAALVFALAMYSKQTSIAAPLASFGLLLIVRPRTGLQGIASMAALGLAALAVLSWLTDGGFLRHVLLYNINRFDDSRVAYIVGLLLTHLGLFGVAMFGLRDCVQRIAGPGGGVRGRLATEPALFGMAVLLAYFTIATVMLALLLKVGSNANYFIEWTAVASILCGIGVRPVVAAAGKGGGGRVPLVLLFLVACALPFQLAMSQDWSRDRAEILSRAEAYPAVVAMIRTARKPVVADPMTLLIRAGRDVMWEPAITAELAHTGLYDEAAFVAMIRAHKFGFFVLQGDPRSLLYRQRNDLAVRAAIADAYPVKRSVADVTLYLPASGAPAQ